MPTKSRAYQVEAHCDIVDAPQQAYGAAVYIRCKYHNDAVTSRLIAAKSKVAPLTRLQSLDWNSWARFLACA